MPRSDFRAILEVLVRHDVRFIVVGGVGAVLQGAPINTFDLDIVHQIEAGNVERLLNALTELDAVYRAQPDRRLRTAQGHLMSAGHQLLVTRFGPLDLLGRIGDSQSYEDLEPHSVTMDLGLGSGVRVLDLATLIRTKEATAGEKDRATLPILRRTLKERS